MIIDENIYQKIHKAFNKIVGILFGFDVNEKLNNGEILQLEYEDMLIQLCEEIKDV